MNSELEKKLIEIAPIFLCEMYGDPHETCMAFGCDCDDGWFEIVKEAVIKLENINKSLNGLGKVVASQIKEKFGQLVIYINIIGNVSDELKNQIESILDSAEEKSWKTCEHCGKPATKTTRGWIQRLCDDCYALRGRA